VSVELVAGPEEARRCLEEGDEGAGLEGDEPSRREGTMCSIVVGFIAGLEGSSFIM
jgi:hypothetical protein